MSFDLEDIIDIIKDDELQPLVHAVIEKLKVFDEDYKTVRQFIISSIVETKAGIYKGLIEKGIPAEHAVLLTVGSTDQLKAAIKSI